MSDTKVFRDREILQTAQANGRGATLLAFLRLSGPGWLQSAITLGGGSLAGSLFLGVIGGYSMLWLQLVAITAGVVMLSAISYVTLSTGLRPYAAINRYINPVLGVGWITATILANMIFILPQFSLCFDALNKNILPQWVPDSSEGKIGASLVIGLLALFIVMLNLRPGWYSRIFDIVLKLIVGLIVICFVMAVVILTRNGQIDWSRVAWGFVPNFSNWNSISPDLAQLLAGVPEAYREFWSSQIVAKQQLVMISCAATAVGINMTFLLPYSMLARGWDKTFRGLAFWDLFTGMAIPFVVVTSCIVIASAFAFHGKVDAALLSDDPDEIQTSMVFNDVYGNMANRLEVEKGAEELAPFQVGENDTPEEVAEKGLARRVRVAEFMTGLTQEERRLSMAVVSPNTAQLARTLVPLLGEQRANLVFGVGVLGMAFSTIIILMLINGFAFAEILGDYQNPWYRITGSLAAGITGVCWFLIWTGASKTYLAIVASTFAILLLPVAYLAFMLMMNNAQLMQASQVKGTSRWLWNIAMSFCLLGAVAAAVSQLVEKGTKPEGAYVIGAVATFLVLMLLGFSAASSRSHTDNGK